MTAALVQICNKCAKPFVKLHGCNKMTCNCGNLQCYVCGANIQDYRHFERQGGSKCPLYESNDTRLDTKIRNAQEEAVKKVMEEVEGLNEDDIRVEGSPVTNGAQTDGHHQEANDRRWELGQQQPPPFLLAPQPPLAHMNAYPPYVMLQPNFPQLPEMMAVQRAQIEAMMQRRRDRQIGNPQQQFLPVLPFLPQLPPLQGPGPPPPTPQFTMPHQPHGGRGLPAQPNREARPNRGRNQARRR